ncbi:MAG: 2-oxoacid:acceptor oxidoreductase subunit alpha [Methanomassiliicoccales archaeon]
MKLPPGTYFMQGNEACVEASLHAGLRFYAGYPITPSTEIAEGLALRIPEEGGIFLQMEDEIASISACIGAAWTGAKALTATSGPGFSLMQESIGYAAMTETPLVVIDVMRGGPSTGLPTKVGQGDVMQAKYGSHGDYPTIVLAPANVQDMFDLTIEAFNFSEKYRVPSIILSDAEIGHMRAKFSVPESIEVCERKIREDKVWHDGFAYDETLVPKMPIFGTGARVHVTGLSHDITGYPSDDPEVHNELVNRLHEKISINKDKICMVDAYKPGSKYMLISYGSSVFPSWEVMHMREDVGLIILKTLWPFPYEKLSNLISESKELIVVEMNMGQVFNNVKIAACMAGHPKVRLFSEVGGEVPSPKRLARYLEEE